ncbi:NUDIX hydrolase [Nocardioides yefusunii]|uniref:NUDIX domain-containing protein n=1 Tax=Nocardioides yefusunii TaxID=2500546 RepID=A0ABW1QWC1_9ACTN|nr:NUDIX hydrolase [Nocardioides yefusunii]
MSLDPSLTTSRPGVALLWWPAALATESFNDTARLVRELIARALVDHGRVEAWIAPEDSASQRLATWSGLQREGVVRGGAVEDGVHHDRILYGRLATDAPVSEPAGFRQLLNAFLPRKRAIAQMLVRDDSSRVLMCELTYKPDLDLPGGVVEVGESPHAAVSREISEELSLRIPARGLLLTDWLPAWSGWDDALCMVFDGGVHDSSLLGRAVLDPREIKALHFCTLDEVRERSADFTARRVEQSLRALQDGASYRESGRPPESPV